MIHTTDSEVYGNWKVITFGKVDCKMDIDHVTSEYDLISINLSLLSMPLFIIMEYSLGSILILPLCT